MMSVRSNSYIVYGVLLPYGAFDAAYDGDVYDFLEPYMDSAFERDANPKNGLTVIRDGMGGKYLVVGRVFAKGDVHQGFDGPPFTIPLTPDWPLAIVRASVEALLAQANYTAPVAFDWIVLTHHR